MERDADVEFFIVIFSSSGSVIFRRREIFRSLRLFSPKKSRCKDKSTGKREVSLILNISADFKFWWASLNMIHLIQYRVTLNIHVRVIRLIVKHFKSG